jgi:alkyl sulfatase BDS1-like metallo-beta-lactamase superfamily hydrolase
MREEPPISDADATVKLTHDPFLRILMGRAGIPDMLFSDDPEVEGSVLDLVRLLSLFDQQDGRFAIVPPRRIPTPRARRPAPPRGS